MSDQNTTSNDRRSGASQRKLPTLHRRRFLQTAAVGLASAGVASGSVSAASGTAEINEITTDDALHTENLTNSYSNPVVLANPISYDGSEPGHARVRNVSSGSFDVQVEEWKYLDGGHVDETIGNLVLEAGDRSTSSGTSLEAGIATPSHDNVESVAFSQSFSRPPVVLSDPQTYNGSDPIVTRNENVSTTGFDVRMQEQESDWQNPYHPQEDVGYLAVEEGVGTLAGRPFEAGKTLGVEDEWYRISFKQEYTDPVFLADMQTITGPDTCGLRYRNLSSTGVEVFVEEEESYDSEVNHSEEIVGYVVFEGSTSNVSAFTSQFDIDDSWETRDHVPQLNNPVAFANPLSYNGSEPCHTRLRNVSSSSSGTSFEVMAEEWKYLDGSHVDETVGSLLLEEGVRTTTSGTDLEAGSLALQHDDIGSVAFSQSFSSAPVVLSEVQTYNGSDPVVTRNENVSTTGFDVRMQEQESEWQSPYHAGETIAYVAVEEGTGTLDGAPFEAGTVTGRDEEWTTIAFQQSYNDPVFLADMQTLNGNDTTGLRYRNLSSTSVEVLLEEEQSEDDETLHDDETVGYLVMEGNPGYLGGGVGYPYTISRSDADYYPTTYTDLKDDLENNASWGEIVWLDDDVVVDPDDTPILMSGGVTLASNRGLDGGTGENITLNEETDSNGKGVEVLHPQGKNRVTGVNFNGPVEYEQVWDENFCIGIEVRGASVEIDNCDMHGWSGMAVTTRGYDPYVHHCRIYDNPAEGYGYGVSVYDGGHPVVQCCTFNNNRHSIASEGVQDTGDINGWTVENCWFGPETTSHVIDHHGPHENSELTVRNCTIEASDATGIKLRHQGDSDAEPEYLDVENCWFHHPTKPDAPGDLGEAIWVYKNEYTWPELSVYLDSNHFGSDDPGDDVGHAR